MDDFKIGEIVICLRYKIENVLCVSENGMYVKKRVDMHWFNRKAKIVEKHETQRKTQYGIEFLDDGHFLSWLDADELVREKTALFGTSLDDGICINLC